jgi:hypothetical protein
MGEEQRRFDRIQEAFSVRCRSAGSLQDPWRNAVTVDVSAGGVSLQTQQLFDPEDRVEIEFRLPGILSELVLTGRIIRIQAHPGGVTEAAVEFLDVTPDQQAKIDDLVQFLKRSP